MNIELLHDALQNDNNLSIINTNIQKIKAEKRIDDPGRTCGSRCRKKKKCC